MGEQTAVNSTSTSRCRIDWESVEMDTNLLVAMLQHKPVGVGKHFQMLLIHHKFCQITNRDWPTSVLWDRLDDMYDLEALDKSEISSFPNSRVRDFELPECEFVEILASRRKRGFNTSSIDDGGECFEHGIDSYDGSARISSVTVAASPCKGFAAMDTNTSSNQQRGSDHVPNSADSAGGSNNDEGFEETSTMLGGDSRAGSVGRDGPALSGGSTARPAATGGKTGKGDWTPAKASPVPTSLANKAAHKNVGYSGNSNDSVSDDPDGVVSRNDGANIVSCSAGGSTRGSGGGRSSSYGVSHSNDKQQRHTVSVGTPPSGTGVTNVKAAAVATRLPFDTATASESQSSSGGSHLSLDSRSSGGGVMATLTSSASSGNSTVKDARGEKSDATATQRRDGIAVVQSAHLSRTARSTGGSGGASSASKSNLGASSKRSGSSSREISSNAARDENVKPSLNHRISSDTASASAVSLPISSTASVAGGSSLSSQSATRRGESKAASSARSSTSSANNYGNAVGGNSKDDDVRPSSSKRKEPQLVGANPATTHDRRARSSSINDEKSGITTAGSSGGVSQRDSSGGATTAAVALKESTAGSGHREQQSQQHQAPISGTLSSSKSGPKRHRLSRVDPVPSKRARGSSSRNVSPTLPSSSSRRTVSPITTAAAALVTATANPSRRNSSPSNSSSRSSSSARRTASPAAGASSLSSAGASVATNPMPSNAATGAAVGGGSRRRQTRSDTGSANLPKRSRLR